MRLHQLRITAFGPFADSADIDFDALSEAGLFLLSGPTGAGKTSILDAVSFAIYGDVPGDRSAAKRLRCDHAAPGVAPRVELELTLAGRRFLVERSPAWTRPKRRGHGETQEHAKVVLSEHLGGQWQPLSTRLDEAGHLLRHLVGLSLTQFCQVALLPQGQFQAFLRARSEERQQLLQQVFRTQRFDQVEKWLRERRGDLRRDSTTREAVVADLVSRVSEVVEAEAPEDWAEAPEDLDTWCSAHAAGVVDAMARRRGEADDATALLGDAQAAHEAGRGTYELLERRRRLRDEQAVLSLQAHEVEAQRQRLERARQAESLAPLLERRDVAGAALRRAKDASAAALTTLSALAGIPVRAADVDPLRTRVAAAIAGLDRLRPGIAEAAPQREELSILLASLEDLDGQDQESEARRQAIPQELEEVQAQLAQAGAARLLVDGLLTRTTHLRARHAAAARVSDLAPRVEEAGLLAHQSAQALVAAKERWLDVREARLEGMASEIASALVVGASCPVCGSHDHPAPASSVPGAPDAAAEREARKEVDDLEATHEARRGHLRDLEQALAVARAEAGPDDDLASLLAQATSELERAEALAATEEGLRDRTRELAAELSGIDVASSQRQQQREAMKARTGAVRHTLATLDAEVDALLATWDCPDVDAMEALLGSLESACDAARAALSQEEVARSAAVEVDALALTAALRAGFDDLEAAAAALLPAGEVAAMTDHVEEHDRRLRRVVEELDSPALRELGDPPVPDLPGLEAEVRRAKAVAEAAAQELGRVESRRARLDALQAELAAALASWLPVRRELDLVDSLTSFVEGRSGDNRLRMRLSAYVLAHRLAQVVAAANTRLWSMSSQRYTLVHTGRRGAGETRGGLSLLVRDEWSGESRDPATLSGGETFVVSLALALGLADVIGGEAGGGEVHTLFVDEGFGALDADTLDDVMDTLDGLRDGGRVVGVVSHVAEMQTRIPSQLRVHKGRQGSHATLHLG